MTRHILSLSGVTLHQRFTDTDHHRQIFGQCRPGLGAHQRVTFTMIGAPLGMTE